MVSEIVSHGSILGCCLKSVNHEQAHNATGAMKVTARRSSRPAFRRSSLTARRSLLTLTSDLLGSILLEDALDHVDLIGLRVDEHAEVCAAEAPVVADGHREPRYVRQPEHREH